MSPIECMAPFLRRARLAASLCVALTACGETGGDSEVPDSGAGGVGGGAGSGMGGAGGRMEPEPVSCEDVLVVDLSQDDDWEGSCARLISMEAIEECVTTKIEDALEPACRKSFDVFVPGTAAENGAWKQFNWMFSRDTGRGYLSLRYQDGQLSDAAQYDQGVIDARDSLRLLLYTLQDRFIGSDVRVFGHSKGSHAVALVAQDPEFAAIQFYAFAQAGRTSTDISNRSDIGAADRGRPGYIEKLRPNLVGITWHNDEVQYYRGDGTNGLELPERWSYPGYIFQSSHDGGNPLSFRIDHHNNYGGSYTDGISTNEWVDGQGTKEPAYPYCATGNSFFGSYAECEKQVVRYVPYFWSDDDCRNLAFDLMRDGNIGDSHYIGHSGPRASGCAERESTIQADYVMVYRINLGDLNDGDCRYDLEVAFDGLDGRPGGGTISVQTSQVADTNWVIKQGSVRVPIHMRIRLTGTITDTSGAIRDCGGVSLAQSESYVQTLRLNFTHPETGVRIDRTVIGLEEGATAFPWPVSLARQNNVAWYENINNVDADLFYAPTRNAIMIKGDTDGGVRGTFYKRLHLID